MSEPTQAELLDLRIRIGDLEHSLKIRKELCDQKDKRIAELESYLERAGWGPCNIPACNCPGWHKLRESSDERKQGERIAELEQINKLACQDWAEDDTAIKKLAAPYIGDFDGPRPENERGMGFRGSVDVVEALVKRIEAMAALLDRVRHEASLPPLFRCDPICPACAWERLKKGGMQ